MANPTTYASARQTVGFAVETTQGTPVVPAVTMPVNKFDPEDKNTWLDDKALRGAMTEPFVRVQGVKYSDVSFDGPGYFDTLPYLLSNIFGDVVYSGTYTGSGTTTLDSPSVVGATSISTVASIAGSTLIQIGTGVNSEVRMTTGVSGGGPYTVTFSGGLVLAHAGGETVKPITSPYSVAFAPLNTGNGQPSSLTITDYEGPTASTGTRAWPGVCLSELTLKGAVDSSTIDFDAKGEGWPSASAAAFTPSISAVTGMAAWRTQVGLNGTVGGAPILTINEWSISIKRTLKRYFTAQNLQVPYSIFRDRLTVSGKLNFVVNDETALTYLNSNTQPQLQIIASNGLAGANLLAIQFDILKAAFTTSKIMRGNAAVEYDVDFDAIANSTNTGYSGGYGPCVVTVQNAVAANGTGGGY